MGRSKIPIQVRLSCLRIIKKVLALNMHIYFYVGSTMINSLPFKLIKKNNYNLFCTRDSNCAYEPSVRELRMEDNSSFINYMRMEPLMFDEILNRVSPRFQKRDTHFRKALEPGLELE